jgi:hypothetical protein
MQTEWRLTFGLWVALGGVAYFTASHPLPSYLLIVAALLTVAVYAWATKHFYDRAERDGTRINHQLARAEALISSDAPPELPLVPYRPSTLGFFGSSLVQTRLAITFLLIGATLASNWYGVAP